MSAFEAQHPRSTAVGTIAGLLAMMSVVLSAIGAGLGFLLEVEPHPVRTIPVAVDSRGRGVRSALLAAAVAAASRSSIWLISLDMDDRTRSPVSNRSWSSANALFDFLA